MVEVFASVVHSHLHLQGIVILFPFYNKIDLKFPTLWFHDLDNTNERGQLCCIAV